ncbi:hypothetical protein LZ32DRAFT_635713 [Colletotrichum eremochloae]|nr:hypothetical protein LZ32DRAFT_635713 [Colletotrichum eremochloae]
MDSNITDLDKRGDLILRFGASLTKDLRVCSRTMARASDVFEKMLFGPFKESQKEDKEWVIELPEDNIKPMTTILAIAHCCHKKVPDSVTISELFELLILGDKYDMTHHLRHYLREWVPQTEDVDFGEDTLLLAWIARNLGAKELFEKAIIEIAKHYPNTDFYPKEGRVGFFNGTKDDGSSFDTHIRASDIIDTAIATQKSLFKSVLKPLREATRQAFDEKACKRYDRLRERESCGNSLFTTLNRGCRSVGIDPGLVSCLTEPLPTYPHSVNNFCWAIQLMKCSNIPDHDSCNPMADIKTDTMRAFGDASVTLSLSQQEYFERRAKISGWYEID